MSTLEPSLSARPLVTSGTATTPPLPVLVAVPAPSERNQVSIVNCDRPSAGASPKVTWSSVPSKSIP